MTFIVEGQDDLKVRKQSLAVSQKTTAFSLESNAFYRYFRGKLFGGRIGKVHWEDFTRCIAGL